MQHKRPRRPRAYQPLRPLLPDITFDPISHFVQLLVHSNLHLLSTPSRRQTNKNRPCGCCEMNYRFYISYITRWCCARDRESLAMSVLRFDTRTRVYFGKHRKMNRHRTFPTADNGTAINQSIDHRSCAYFDRFSDFFLYPRFFADGRSTPA